MAVTVNGSVSNVVYGKGDVCLKLNPFDNYRMFTLYEDWRSDDRKPLDLSNGQKLYLVFKSKNKEIRIPEYDLIDSDYTVDKVNGQVLFKISKKNAIDILAMSTKTFYITRVYDIVDGVGGTVVGSDEEVLYTGLWKEEGSNTVDNYTSQIKNLMKLLEERNKQIEDLQGQLASLLEKNLSLTTTVSDLQEANNKLTSDVSDLEIKLNEYESGTEYAGEIISETNKMTIVKGNKYSEDQLKELAEHLEEISQN